MESTPRSQRGMTLLVGLIMLVLMTMIALTTFNVGKTNQAIVGNMQHRNEGIAAAEMAVEMAVSTTKFFDTPNAVFAPTANCAVNNAICVDANGDGKTDFTVSLTPPPTCLRGRVIMLSELDLSKSEDLDCTKEVKQTHGMAGTGTGESLCAESLWEITAEAVDPNTSTKVTVAQGFGVRIDKEKVATDCI